MDEATQFLWFLIIWLSVTTTVGISLEVMHQHAKDMLEEAEGRKKS